MQSLRRLQSTFTVQCKMCEKNHVINNIMIESIIIKSINFIYMNDICSIVGILKH